MPLVHRLLLNGLSANSSTRIMQAGAESRLCPAPLSPARAIKIAHQFGQFLQARLGLLFTGVAEIEAQLAATVGHCQRQERLAVHKGDTRLYGFGQKQAGIDATIESEPEEQAAGRRLPAG